MSHNYKKTRKELQKKLDGSLRYIEKVLDDITKTTYDDPLRHEYATALATKLRVLLSDTKKNSSLSHKLGIKKHLLFQSECIDNPDYASNLMFSSSLVGLQINKKGELFCIPIVPNFNHKLLCTFNVWWNEIVIDTKGNDSALISRKDVVLTLSDKEGGAHEDDSYADEYYRINYENGFTAICADGSISKLKNNYYVESLIVIASELLDAFALFKEHFENKIMTHEETSFSILQLSYIDDKNGRVKKRNRYFSNADNNICKNIIMGFDYYRLARYSLIRLKGIVAKDVINNTVIKFLVIDNSTDRHLVYLRANEFTNQSVLLMQEKGYILVKCDEDIYRKQEEHELEYYKRKFGKDEYTFADFLSKQILK